MKGNAIHRKLIMAAKKARRNAYAPYSKFKVGAAVLTDGGKIFSGCNVENASYGLTQCAERVAIAKAVSEGATRIRAPSRSRPCGAGRYRRLPPARGAGTGPNRARGRAKIGHRIGWIDPTPAGLP